MKLLRNLNFALIAIAIIQVLYYYPKLPDIVASHFDGAGVADGWSSRQAFFALYLGILLLVVGVFLLLPQLYTAREGFSMNIPNRDYWLAPERHQQTRDFFCRQMALMGVAHLAIAMLAIQMAIAANLKAEVRLGDGLYWALGAYAVFLIAWLFHFYRYFRRP